MSCKIEMRGLVGMVLKLLGFGKENENERFGKCSFGDYCSFNLLLSVLDVNLVEFVWPNQRMG